MHCASLVHEDESEYLAHPTVPHLPLVEEHLVRSHVAVLEHGSLMFSRQNPLPASRKQPTMLLQAVTSTALEHGDDAHAPAVTAQVGSNLQAVRDVYEQGFGKQPVGFKDCEPRRVAVGSIVVGGMYEQ